MAHLSRILLYVRDIDKSAAFYQEHFGYRRIDVPDDRIVELVPSDGGSGLMLHQAAKSLKLGQAAVKLVFNVDDVQVFAQNAARHGLKFGKPFDAGGYRFANARDPDGNSIQITGRPLIVASNS